MLKQILTQISVLSVTALVLSSCGQMYDIGSTRSGLNAVEEGMEVVDPVGEVITEPTPEVVVVLPDDHSGNEDGLDEGVEPGDEFCKVPVEEVKSCKHHGDEDDDSEHGKSNGANGKNAKANNAKGADWKVLICHKPGTPAEKNKLIPEAALKGHLGHGDLLGGCDLDNVDHVDEDDVVFEHCDQVLLIDI